MSRPPIKAMEAVKRYCEKKKTCDGCPLYSSDKFGIGYSMCAYSPVSWEIMKEGKDHANT